MVEKKIIKSFLKLFEKIPTESTWNRNKVKLFLVFVHFEFAKYINQNEAKKILKEYKSLSLTEVWYNTKLFIC